ncbi:MAG: DnaJ domain-containing protein [Solirubrobacteraceae bacterium]|jgi:curved DNA-binding protein CbpA
MRIVDPYQVLGVGRDASDAEVRAAYRKLVQRHHPDHNAGSAESAKRFEEVQDAYAQIKELRAKAPPSRHAPPRQAPRTSPSDPGLESRLADLERAVREAHQARERAEQAARQAAREAATQATDGKRASDEELGYIKTDDSLSKIFDDALSQLSHKLAGARDSPIAKRVEDLIEDLDFLHSRDDTHK